MEPEIKSMNHSEWSMLIILSILWGGSFFFVGVAVKVLAGSLLSLPNKVDP